MANFPGSAPVAVNVSVSPAAGVAVDSAPATVSEALAPPAPADARPVLPQGVVDANAPPESTAAPALDANPHKTAATLESSLVSLGIDPAIAKFGGGRVMAGLQQPAPTAEQIQSSAAESHSALQAEFGEDTDAILHLARQEVREISQTYPDFLPLLVRAGLSSDLQTIKLLAGRGHEKWLAGKRAEFGLPAAR